MISRAEAELLLNEPVRFCSAISAAWNARDKIFNVANKTLLSAINEKLFPQRNHLCWVNVFLAHDLPQRTQNKSANKRKQGEVRMGLTWNFAYHSNGTLKSTIGRFSSLLLLSMRIHAFHRLYQHRLSLSTKPFNARGCKVVRCEFCKIKQDSCICDHQPNIDTNIATMVILSDNEILKFK